MKAVERTDDIRSVSSNPTLSWLIRLRSLAVFGQAVTIGVAIFALRQELLLMPLVLLVILTAMSNFLLSIFARSVAERRAGVLDRTVGAVLVFDTLVLTCLLYYSGGAANPFTTLFLVHITLSAVMLDGRWTWAISALSVVCFALLFIDAAPMETHHVHHSDYSVHLYGMWVAFAVAAGLVSFFVSTISKTISVQRERIAAMRDVAARNARLASLTTLAAGAAHELGNPLGTMAIAAGEMQRMISQRADESIAQLIKDDTTLIQKEIERCRVILDQMSARSDFMDSKSQTGWQVDELIAGLKNRLDASRRRRLHVHCVGVPDRFLTIAYSPLMYSLSALVNNAFDASNEEQVVHLRIEANEKRLVLHVDDSGRGMSADVLERAGEPFFTTKDVGRGMGLGLFVARAFAQSLDGSLQLNSDPKKGTRASLRLPLSLDRVVNV